MTLTRLVSRRLIEQLYFLDKGPLDQSTGWARQV